MSRFRDALRSGLVILMDGAMGSELRRAGLPAGGCGEEWNLAHPDQVRGIHQAYKEAGAHCFLTNTFQANPAALTKHGLAGRLEDINQAAITIVRSVAGPADFVLADVGPFEPAWNEEAIQQIMASFRGVDGIFLETFSDTDALWAAKYGTAAQSDDIPVLVSITYKKSPDGVLMTQAGQSPRVFAQLALQYRLAALGVNCGRDVDLDDIIEIVRSYRQETDLPLFARPNAGTPLPEKGLVYPRSPEEMASRLPELLEAGVALVGGCCGTTPEYIAAFRPIVESWNARHQPGGYI